MAANVTLFPLDGEGALEQSVIAGNLVFFVFLFA